MGRLVPCPAKRPISARSKHPVWPYADSVASFTMPLPNVSGFVRAHYLWILGLTPFGLAALRIFWLSGGDPSVFPYVLQSFNVVALVMGALLPIIPLLAFWVLFFYLDRRRSLPKSKRQSDPPWLWIFMGFLGSLSLYMTGTFALIIFVTLLIGIIWRGILRSKHRKNRLKIRR